MKPEYIVTEIRNLLGIDIGIDVSEYEDCTVVCFYKKDAEVVIAALEKQIPKKPIICGENPDGTYQFKCPECGRLWWEKSYITKYCDKCGNLIDRSEKDES